METTILTHKLLCVSNPQQCNTSVIMLAAHCVEEVQFNLSKFLLNEILWDTASAQDDGTPFHYAWLIILISFTIWSDSAEYKQINMPLLC